LRSNRFSASQENPSILWKTKIHYRVYKCPPPVSILSQINPVNASSHFLNIHFSRLRLGLPSGLFPSGLPTKTLYAPLLSPIRATCNAHLILNNLFYKAIWIQFNMISPASLNSFLKHLHYEGQCLRMYVLSYGEVSWLRICVTHYSFFFNPLLFITQPL